MPNSCRNFRQVWRRKLLRFVVWTSYFNALLVGALPGTVNWKKIRFEKSRFYLCYSFVVHLSLLVALAFIFNNLDISARIAERSKLKIMYSFSGMAKVLAVIMLCAEIWSKRRLAISLLMGYKAFLQRNRRFAGTEKEEGVVYFLVAKFFMGYAINFVSSATRIFMLQGVWSLDLKDIITTVFDNVHMTLLLMAMNQFCYVLSRLEQHFCAVNRALQDVKLQLRFLARYKRCLPAGSSFYNRHSERLARRLHALSVMHFDCYVLAQRIFQLQEVASVTCILKLFAKHVSILYHFVLFVVNLIYASGLGDLLGILLTVAFSVDLVLMLVAIQRVITACNETGSMLREFNELLDLQDNSLMRAIEGFSSHLRCHKLAYKVCGLFKVNKESSLVYFLTVSVHVLVLVQFDMQNRLY